MRKRNVAPVIRRTVESPTVALAVVIHASWFALTAWHDKIPPLLLFLSGGWIIAWHNSLQHETIHGHPTRSRAINTLLGWAPYSLWLPYSIYRDSHIAHHATRNATDPFDDPESRYLAKSGTLVWFIEKVQQSLIGRLLLGPFLSIFRFLGSELIRAYRQPGGVLRDWLPHAGGVLAILIWLDHCGLGLGQYILCFVLPGTSLSLLRSFAEHRADADAAARVATVERGGPLALLYLNNNLHAAHHARPDLAWYRLPGFNERLLRERGSAVRGPVYRSYWSVIRRFAFRVHDDLVHPDYRGEAS
ncbi:fatty acid desaturase [Blastomonas sp.]|uniref:fatty acid desaturase n=1 Tax=Blastomonas sp. TaxID=1909299 RepID=UPI00261AA01B|nr:fatty acid desaturase [Blastomonas sp.]MDM7957397.1 fatty acid desaturase [Blastomonas sp.]